MFRHSLIGGTQTEMPVAFAQANSTRCGLRCVGCTRYNKLRAVARSPLRPKTSRLFMFAIAINLLRAIYYHFLAFYYARNSNEVLFIIAVNE